MSRKSQLLIDQHANVQNHASNYIVLPQGSLLLPTFCDLHLHAPQFLYQGTGLDRPLMQWLDAYALKAEARLDAEPQLAKRVYDRLAQRLRENGTGTVVLFGTIKNETKSVSMILARSMLQAGIRAFVGKVSMDIDITPEHSPTHGIYIEPSTSASLANAKQFLDDIDELLQLNDFSGGSERRAREKRYVQSLIRPVLTPRFVPTCTDELLKSIGGLAYERDVWIQTHVHEARDEVEWVRGSRGMEGLEILSRVCWSTHLCQRGNLTNHSQNNLLTSRTILSHCTYLPSDEECATFSNTTQSPVSESVSQSSRNNLNAATKTAVTDASSLSLASLPPTPYHSDPPLQSLKLLSSRLVTMAHCPLSNFYFSAGRAFPLREALSTGCRVGYGTDIAGGYSADVMNTMRTGVITGRGREGGRKEAEKEISCGERGNNNNVESLAIDWKESLYIATRGGAIALGLKGMFVVGGTFDAQEIKLYDSVKGQGVGPLDFFDAERDLGEDSSTELEDPEFPLNEDAIEKWWCLGDFRNRGRMWVLGREI
ncbi:hypothetical protein CVT24_013108 [Panaeolus cyanescens]|uniref:Amidohydrolase-related domain-containing protein n=1 Tax=Panaeolus cyanescens TaxID=181874 RepID=A0A409YNA2_9AGAR|nr:hypothetical protein CVT24_013108 [Panaeolus cyanescens]